MALSASPVEEEPQPGNDFRNHLATAVRSINWSYAVFWSVSSTGGPGVLTWKDGFYNGEVKTRKVTNSTTQLTADQLALQRSEQLRELHESLQLSAECGGGDHRGRPPRPVAALSPEDLGDTEWFYVVCMTYTFRPGQGLPGKSLVKKEHVWLRNAHLADSKTFPRVLFAKTIVCIPLMDGVLELGTTESTMEDPDLVNRATTPFGELQFPAACTEEPNSSPSANDTGEYSDIIVFEDMDHTAAMEAMISEVHELRKVTDECLPHANVKEVTMEINELYSICEGLDVQPLEDDWISIDGLLEVPPSPEPSPEVATDNADHTLSTPVDRYRLTSFTPWTRSDTDDVGVTATGREPQKLLKKVLSGGAWANNGGGDGSTTRTSTQESGIKNHVMSERRRREKLNEMFLILKSFIPSTRKVDKASILAETIAYLKELERRVQELESTKELSVSRPTASVLRRHGHDDEVVRSRKQVSGAKRKKGSELDAGGDRQKDQHWVRSKDGPSNVSITVADKEVLLDVQCRWKERLIARVFDAVKRLHLNILSVQSSTLDGLMGLKVRAQFASSAAVAPGMITEALQKAISSKP
ncbi:Anthocyanin regulatory Lc protein [Dichanthelium oligosanthes]|uniref:Anthocyanin regulatory Lc protein n=1 Tax=Dichanthelium oligosanthes TaxID=888268 RepID=A0A1E5WGQ2_9POAL|nr:Anthocyanin regulatory Lc protein [Dichanthelium oligosanthes]